LLIAFLAAGYWYAWRPLPETTGEIAAPISSSATITRDELGVPHIKAASWEDAIFLQGYTMAQDRLWQMDALRRRAAGELAEVTGRMGLASDEEARHMRLRRIAEMHEKSLTPGERALFAAFARGVNHFIATHRARLPLEFTLLRYDPRPWTVRDSILAGLEMYRFLTPNWRVELMKAKMAAQGEPDKVEFLFPVRTGGEPQPGSNAWVISGARSASGKPVLSNDPHLEVSLLSPWYMVHLQAPGLDVAGAAIAGLPAVIVGHNQRIAWGMTNLEFDVQDLYLEQIDIRSGRYLLAGKLEQAVAEPEVIAVRNAPPASALTWVTKHGPIFVNDQGKAYSLRWTGAEPGGLTYPFLDINRASNWADFTAALGRFAGPGQNFVYADVDGNIGYHAAGHIPIRKNCQGDVPADGALDSCEWTGFVPFDELPHQFNPPSGIIATANQNPFPADAKFPVNGNFAPPYRVQQIRALLASRSKWKPEDMIGVQTDVYSHFHHFLARQIVEAWDRQQSGARATAPPGATEAIEELRKWNGQMENGQSAPMIAALAFEQLQKLAAERAAGGFGESYNARMSTAALERLLRERPPDWFPDYDQLLVRCLAGAVDAGITVQGSRISRWDYGRAQAIRWTNPIAGRLPVIGRYFNIGPVPMRGSPVSVLQYGPLPSGGRLAPSLRMTVDLADMNHSFLSIATGQSAHRLSPHYKDQWEAFYNGRTFPMQFSKVDARQVLAVKPEK
jgi:penicillin amidase